jgi:uncharacterized membrane protein YgcG
MKIKFAKFLFIFILFGLFANSVVAESYPAHTDNYVNDFAKVVSASDKQQLETQLQQFQQQTGVQITIATVNSIYDYNTGDPTIEVFARNLFNYWGVGDKTKNNGILMLVAVKDRKVRIELGSGYGKQYDAEMQKIVDNDILPNFKNEQYGTGIIAGTQGIISSITQGVSWFAYYKWDLLLGVLILFLIIAGISCMRSGKTGWGWAFFAAAGAILLWLIVNIFKKGSGGTGFGGGSSSGGGATGSW